MHCYGSHGDGDVGMPRQRAAGQVCKRGDRRDALVTGEDMNGTEGSKEEDEGSAGGDGRWCQVEIVGCFSTFI